MFRLSNSLQFFTDWKVCFCRGSDSSPAAVTHPVGVCRSDDWSQDPAIPWRVPEAGFRFSRDAHRCSCSSSTRRYSCSNKRHPRSHSHCCSNGPTHGLMESSALLSHVFSLGSCGVLEGGLPAASHALFAHRSAAFSPLLYIPVNYSHLISSSFSISPMKQRRAPTLELEYDEALFELE